MNRPPPPSQTRLLSRFRSAFFATPGCALLTLLSLAVLWLMAESLTRWLIIDAVFGGEDREACASGGGMCWPFVAAKIELWIYGRYPAAERWRADMAFALLAFVLLQVATARHKTAAAVLSALLPVAVYILLRGGVFGLPEVATQLWGGVMLTLVIAVTGKMPHLCRSIGLGFAGIQMVDGKKGADDAEQNRELLCAGEVGGVLCRRTADYFIAINAQSVPKLQLIFAGRRECCATSVKKNAPIVARKSIGGGYALIQCGAALAEVVRRAVCAQKASCRRTGMLGGKATVPFILARRNRHFNIVAKQAPRLPYRIAVYGAFNQQNIGDCRNADVLRH